MANDVVVKQNSALAAPSDVAALFGGVKSNFTVGEQVPHLSSGGKVWKVVIDGNEKPIMTMVDGEPMPAPTVKVIVVNQMPNRSRAFYEGQYVEGSSKAPDCYSADGVRPDADVKEPQASTCATCPQSVKGSKINDNGDAGIACSSLKNICVVPSNKPDFTALKLKLAVTSLWEAEPKEEANGWYAWEAYQKFLKSNGVPHTAAVETIMKFDSNVKYPKILFKYNGYLPLEVASVVVPRIESEEVQNVLGMNRVAKAADTNSEPATKQKTKPAEQKEEKKESKTVVDDSGFGETASEPEKTEPKKTEAKKEKKESKPTEVVEVDGGADDKLTSLLSDWD